MPSSYALPVVPTSVIALSCVAITDRPTAHHGRLRFARKYPSISFVRRLARRPLHTIQVRYTTTTTQSSQRMVYEKCAPSQYSATMTTASTTSTRR